MSKKKVSKALPIVAIVFYGVSLILFIVKTVFMVSYGAMNGYAFSTILMTQSFRTIVFALPPIFFIIYAAQILKRKKAKVMLTVALALQATGAAYFGTRIAINNRDWGQLLGKENAFILCFAALFVCCVVGLILTLGGKKAAVPIIIAAIAGFGVAIVLFVWNGKFMLNNSAYYTAHIVEMTVRLIAYTVYTVALIFDFTALILVSFIKEREKKVTVKMKAKSPEAE